ncbi:MAG TPA: ABC transporter permease [Dermatophilaceae bacterium]|nr:ABC transporter permease [Dermatophilaceae bacterium]
MTGELTGTAALIRLALRRDRVLIPAWIVFFAATVWFSASATVGLYPSQASRIEAANTINATASMVALYGPIYDPTSLGALSMLKMTAIYTALMSILMVMLVVRHTRAEEEAGRLELVGAGVVGRAAPMAAALLVVGGASCVLGLLTAAGLVAAGLPLVGSLAFGAGWAATGLCFSAVAAVAAQLTTGGRAANGLGFTVIAAAYAARAIGDLAEAGPGWLSWLSPIGWHQQIRAFAGDRWPVLILPLAATALLVPVAFTLRRRRDLGSGLLRDRPGPAAGALSSPFGLAWRLQRPMLVAWTTGSALMAFMMGSIANSISGLLDSPEMAKMIQQLGGEQGLTDAFLAAELGLISTIIAAYGIAAVGRLRTEELEGRAEDVLATATPRIRWAASHWLFALAGVAWLMLVTGVATGIGHAVAIGDPGQVLPVTVAALARIPAAWVLVSLVVAVWGLWPHASGVVWGAYAACIVVGEFGQLWDVPQWVMDFSPFTHSPVLPGPDAHLWGLLWLTVVAGAFLAAGSAAFRHRDLAG